MQSKTTSARVWTGRVISALPILFLLFDAVIKLANIKPVQESFQSLLWAGLLLRDTRISAILFRRSAEAE